MQLLKGETNFQFMAKRRLAMIISAILILVSIGSLAARGLNFGLDFTGGTLIELGYPESVKLEPLRKELASNGFESAVILHFGTTKEVLIRVPPVIGLSNADLGDKIVKTARNLDDHAEIRRIEFVGPQVGDELTEQGALAMLVALIGILIYVALRFQYRFSLGSVAALVHDVIITLGMFSIFQFEFDLTVLAALLAVIGYSLNDTIVVFDRIRENFLAEETLTSEETMNLSINQTLSRTIMTSVTTLLVLIALFIWGGEVIAGFATALIIGVVVGTYSSIYVASAAALALGIKREYMLPVEREDSEEFGQL